MSKKLFYLISFVLVPALILTGVANGADPDLLGWWKFDGDASDSSGNGHDGVLFGNPQWVTGRIGGALEFDGVDDRVEMPGTNEAAGFAFTGEVTWAAWFKTGSSARGTIMVQDPPGAAHVSGNRSLNVETSGMLRIRANGVGALNSYNSNVAVNDDQWHHVAVTIAFETNGNNDTMKLYIDGDLSKGYEIDSVNINANRANATGFIIVLGYNGGNPFSGPIDDVRVYSRVLTEDEIQQVMKGTPPGLASNPSPANEATDVPREVVLGWEAGEFAAPTNGHKVYFGENFNDVNDASGAFAQSAASYTPPQRLDFGQTYYWRVDEVNAPPNSNVVFKGEVWSFTVEPFAYQIAPAAITATASSVHDVDTIPENTVNGSGLDADDLHSTEESEMWLSDQDGPEPAWIQYEFDKVYKLHEMWVWNHNSSFEDAVGWGVREAIIEYSSDGSEWSRLGDTHEFTRAAGEAGYAHDTTVNFDGVGAKYVKITVNSNWGGFLTQYGLSEVRFLYIPVQAREPGPDSGATDVALDLSLSWRPGREAARHDVYFSTSRKDVANSTADVTPVTEASYGPLSLDLGDTYYWRVDEVNDAETPSVWQGEVWNFTTQPYFVVDDFEIYDANENQIWYAWRDGLGFGTQDSPPYNPGNGTGSEVGDGTTASYTEEGIVNSGAQAMPYWYNNNKQDKFNYSEAAMTLTSGRDWTQRGIKALTLWFRGYPESVGSFTENPAGIYTMTATGADIYGTADHGHFALKQLTGAGSIVAKVERVLATHNWAKAGVMIRDTLDTGSVHGMMIVSPAQGVAFQRRTTADASSSGTTISGIAAPQWVKIERDLGGNVTASYSDDGIAWTQVGMELITMDAPVYIGLALTSHDNSETCEAVFSNVTITGQVGSVWMSQDIGIPGNDPEPMYVAVANNTGAPAVVYHDDPAATQIDTWTEWNIELKEFSDKGVNLTDVNSIAIGFGDRDNPVAGGAGKMYFDDIRVYPRRCVASLARPAADLNDDCVVDIADIEIISNDWLVSGYDVTVAAASDANLEAHYELDGNLLDSSGNNYHGDPCGVVAYAAGQSGQAIELRGTPGSSYVNVPGYVGVVGTQSRTCTAWINTHLTGEIVSWGQNVAGQKWIFRVQESNGVIGAIRVEVNGGYIVGTTDVRDDQWHHVAAVLIDDGTPNVTEIELYVDGVREVVSASLDEPINTAANGVVQIGQAPWGVRPFTGQIDDVRIYSRVVTHAEIANLAGMNVGTVVQQPLQTFLSTTADIDLHNDEVIDFKDFAALAGQWLDELLWPTP